MTAGTPLRLVHLEDNPLDRELVAATLRAEGIDCSITAADTRESFEEAIAEKPDLIIADHSLPGFDGLAAQAIAHERWPGVPFVVLTGTLGEELAIDRMKSGATDYVLKHRLERLPGAVRRALQEAEDRRERRRVEAELRRLNAELEARVIERTRALEDAKTALEQRERFVSSVIDNLPLMLFVKDAKDLRFVRFNKAGEELTGLSRDELIGRSDSDFFPADQAAAFTAGDREVLRGTTAVDITEEPIDTRRHGRRFLHTKKIPIFDDQGRPQYLVGISQDITEQKCAQEALVQARHEAERANRAKSEFLSRMSHDLRTPLNAILGFAQVLQLDALPREQADSVAQILKGGRYLLDLINEVLDIARIEAGQLSLSPEPVAVTDIVHHALDLVRPLAATRRITLETADLPGETCALADRQRLNQILLNLLSNAVKYNREDGTVRVTAVQTAPDRVRILVSDSGAGIPPEKLGMLFTPFERLGAEQSGVEGTGLGLALSKGLAEAMNASLGVESVVDQGTTFWIDLPACAALTEREETNRRPVDAAGRKSSGVVLYIEDNTSNVRLMQRLLQRRPGVTLLHAADGLTGLTLLRQHRPALVFLDLHLPDTPGEEVLRRVWEDPATRGTTVAVLSADAMPAQRRRLLASGATTYLTKPFDIAEVLELVDRVLDRGDG